MASLAVLLKLRGHIVSGSDENVYPPMSDLLAENNVAVHKGFSPKNLEPLPDLVVIGNALSRGNPEVEAVLSRKIPYISCLLYTSPSPRDGLLSRMPSSA